MQLALEAAIERALLERHHLILEGVHVIPTELNPDIEEGSAVVVPVMLASLKREMLYRQLERRDRENSKRQASRYLKGFDAIWELQSWLLNEADRAGIPIIESTTIEDTVRAVLDLVITGIMQQFPPDAGEEVLVE